MPTAFSSCHSLKAAGRTHFPAPAQIAHHEVGTCPKNGFKISIGTAAHLGLAL